MRVYTRGHRARAAEELVACLVEARVATLVDVRRYLGSRRHPQFNRGALEAAVRAVGIAYRHVEELGEPGEERFACVRPAAFASYAARMGSTDWQRRALA